MLCSYHILNLAWFLQFVFLHLAYCPSRFEVDLSRFFFKSGEAKFPPSRRLKWTWRLSKSKSGQITLERVTPRSGCVCGALPYSFSNGLVVHKPTRPSREIRVCRTKGGERGGIERLVPVDYTSRLFHLDVLIPACMLTYCLTQAHLTLLAWGKLSSMLTRWCWLHASRAGHPSVVRQQAVNNYWASLNSALADGHSLQRTPLNPRICPRILISKRARWRNVIQIVRPSWGLNPRAPATGHDSVHWLAV